MPETNNSKHQQSKKEERQEEITRPIVTRSFLALALALAIFCLFVWADFRTLQNPMLEVVAAQVGASLTLHPILHVHTSAV